MKLKYQSSPFTARSIRTQSGGRCVALPGEHAWMNLQAKMVDNPLIGNTLAIVLIAVINLVCFGNVLGCYFYADDFTHLSYLHEVFTGHPELLLENFFSRWLSEKSIHLLYRPLVEVTLAFDYLLWKTNPVGYHLTNVIYQIISASFLFLLVKQFMRGVKELSSSFVALLTASLFSAFPLHAEVVAWTIGRVDGLCVALYLCSFWLFLRAHQKQCRWSWLGSLAAMMLSLLTKEMAVTLPLVIFCYCLLCRDETISWGRRIANSWRDTRAFWCLLIMYFVVRTLVLGTPIGGYIGDVAELCRLSFGPRLFQSGSFWQFVFPFNDELIAPKARLMSCVRAMYFSAGIIIFMRSFWHPWSKELLLRLGFTALWFVISLLPTYQVWNLLPNLSGSRLAYLATVPLCLFWALILTPAGKREAKARKSFSWIEGVVGYLLAACFVFCFGVMTSKNNLAWVHASREIVNLKASIEEIVRNLPKGKKIVVLSLPQQIEGAHLFYTFEMFQGLFRPPLSACDLTARIVSLEPRFYGDQDLFNVSRFREMVASEKYLFLSVENHKSRLQGVLLSCRASDAIQLSERCPFSLEKIDKLHGCYVYSVNASGSPLGVDFVEVEAVCGKDFPLNSTNEVSHSPMLWLTWKTVFDKNKMPELNHLSVRVRADGRPHVYRFSVSQHKSWSLAKQIGKIKLQCDVKKLKFELVSVQLKTGRNLIPLLHPDVSSLSAGSDGIYRLAGAPSRFFFDASKVLGAKSAVAEISRPYTAFSLLAGTYRETELSKHAMQRLYLKELKGAIEVKRDRVPDGGWYQLRIGAISESGKIVGYLSDPVYFEVAPRKMVQSESNKSS